MALPDFTSPDGLWTGTITWTKVVPPPVVPPVIIPPVTPPVLPVVYPSDLLDLTNWKLTLPINNAQEQLNLKDYSLSPYFVLGPTGSVVLFRAYCGGVGGQTTSGSDYARSELREMLGTKLASWGSTDGRTHTLTTTVALTHLPVVKPQVVVGQVHTSSDDLIEILATGDGKGNHRVGVRWQGSETSSPLIPSIPIGTAFKYSIVCSPTGVFTVTAGVGKQTFSQKSSGLYFKAGCYTQSNVAKGKDLPTAYGESAIYSLAVTHV